MKEVAWQFYHSPAQTWDAMIDACNKAKRTIELEQYIISNDNIGRKFFRVFINKLQQGVKVRVLCDWFGSKDIAYISLVRKFKEHGGEILFYNPLSKFKLFKISTWFKRDHRKVLIIDSKMAFVGGLCLDGSMYKWRDTTMSIDTHIVAEVSNCFEQIWNQVKYNKDKLALCYSTLSRESDNGFRCLSNNEESRDLSEELIQKIKQAKKSIYLVTAYFMPEPRLFNTLKQAVQRGVEVTLIAPKITKLPFIDYVAISYYREAFQAGIKVYKYKLSVIHAKYALIDDNWATVGSMNLDYLSFKRNNELNIIIEHPAALDELKKQFFQDLHHSKEAFIEDLKNSSLKGRIIEILGCAFHAFL